MNQEYLNVSQINAYISQKLKMDGKLKNIYVRGEISSYKSYPNGHDYFTIKDDNSQLKCVLYKNQKRFLTFEPKKGMKVIVKGSIDVYLKSGYYQLKANRITEDGIGAAHQAFERLKIKLKDEGLFEDKYKKEVPKFPKRIGVVTAKTGSVIRDIITTIKRRYPKCEILIFSTLVQGDHAAKQIASQIRFSENFDLDTLIVGRGGGSPEELMPFNEENVARAIFECKTPVISAVGHETDYSIADLVADLRAPTPTAAAELAVPEIKELNYRISQLKSRSEKFIQNKLMEKKNRLNAVTTKQIMKNPESIYEINQMHLDHLISNLNSSSNAILTANRNRLKIVENSAIFKSPESIYDSKEMKLENLIRKISYSSKNIISENKNRLELIKRSKTLKNPEKIYADKQMIVDEKSGELKSGYMNLLSQKRDNLEMIKESKILKNPEEIKNRKEEKLSITVSKLNILNPVLTLQRGYSMAKKNNKVITSSKDVEKGDEIDIKFKDGIINTKVI